MEESFLSQNSISTDITKIPTQPILGNLIKTSNFKNRFKYSMKNLVIADFSNNKFNFKLNKLYAALMISISFCTFTFITYGLSSSLTTIN